MEFTLLYRGDLKSNGSRTHKHEIRKHFHKQLSVLWEQQPLMGLRDRILPMTEGDKSIPQKESAFEFVPLVCNQLGLVAEIKLFLLWPAPPGAIFTQGGDIDNRLKTLLDALKVPHEDTALPEEEKPEKDEVPFFCLLEDDKLITKISVETNRLLLLPKDFTPARIESFIHVSLRLTQARLDNLSLGVQI